MLYSKARKGAIVSNLKSRYRLLSICVVINVTINICIIVQIVCATPTLKHKMLCIDGFLHKTLSRDINYPFYPRIFRFVQELVHGFKSEPEFAYSSFFPYFFVYLLDSKVTRPLSITFSKNRSN